MLCGGEDDRKGIYGGELIEDDVRHDAENRLVRIDAIYAYPDQRAIVTNSIAPRLPLPYGAIVRTRIIGPDKARGAPDSAAYAVMIGCALKRKIEEAASLRDRMSEALLKARKNTDVGIDPTYCRR